MEEKEVRKNKRIRLTSIAGAVLGTILAVGGITTKPEIPKIYPHYTQCQNALWNVQSSRYKLADLHGTNYNSSNGMDSLVFDLDKKAENLKSYLFGLEKSNPKIFSVFWVTFCDTKKVKFYIF